MKTGGGWGGGGGGGGGAKILSPVAGGSTESMQPISPCWLLKYPLGVWVCVLEHFVLHIFGK